jgi:hypothetical protein
VRRVWLIVIWVGLLGVVRPAVAEEKPWAKGVPQASQDKALAIYREGNTEFGASRYAQALAKYREAIKHWDHPAIRFNMAVCLVNLDQPLEAHDHLERALKYGVPAIGADAHAQGLTYRKLLDGQLATLEVTCDEAGAEVTLDGKPLFKAPGKSKQLLTPGTHHVVATKQGYMTENAPLVLLPGKTLAHDVKLLPIQVSSKLVRRWKARTPWLVVASGMGAAAIGGTALYFSKQEYDTYDALVAAQCPLGCNPDGPEGMQQVHASTEEHRTRARIENVVGVSLVAVGGTVAIAGLVGVYLNLPRRVIEHAPAVTPVITAGGAGASVQWSF